MSKNKTLTATTKNGRSMKNNTSMLSNTQLSTAELTAEIAKIDFMAVGWNNIEAKFQELKAMLSAPTSGLNASQARVQQKQAVSAAIQKLLDMAQGECRRLLVEGNAKAAVEGGLKTLELKKEYYGNGSLQLVSSYFHLARTNQYMDKFKRAEEFLSLAQYEILRHPDAAVSLKAELHQTFGLLYASDGKLDAALKHLTCATYYLAVMNGPEHILTSFGYFDLGNVFAAKSNMENAMAFYDKVKDIWYTHLTQALRLVLDQGSEQHQDIESVLPFGTPASFGEENIHDAAKMLRGIVGLQRERFGQVHPNTAKAEFVLGMFLLWNDDTAGSFETLLRALEIMKREYGERHPSTGEVRTMMLNFGMQVPDDTSYVLDENPGAAEQQQQSPTGQDDNQPSPDGNAGTREGHGPETGVDEEPNNTSDAQDQDPPAPASSDPPPDTTDDVPPADDNNAEDAAAAPASTEEESAAQGNDEATNQQSPDVNEEKGDDTSAPKENDEPPIESSSPAVEEGADPTAEPVAADQQVADTEGGDNTEETPNAEEKGAEEDTSPKEATPGDEEEAPSSSQ